MHLAYFPYDKEILLQFFSFGEIKKLMPKSSKLWKALWTKGEEGIAFFNNDWARPSLPSIFDAETRLPLKNIRPIPAENLGFWSAYFIKGGHVCFQVLMIDAPELDQDAKIYLTGSFNNWHDAIGNEEWRLKFKGDGIERWEISFPLAYFDTNRPYFFKFYVAPDRWLSIPERMVNCVDDGSGNLNLELLWTRGNNYAFAFKPPHTDYLKSKISIYLAGEGHKECIDVSSTELLGMMETSIALGAIIEGNTTTFRIFAPRATSVTLHLHKTLDENEKMELPMLPSKDGIWENRLNTNLEGTYYYYTVDGIHNETTAFDPSVKILDPYAKAAVSPAGPGIITARHETLINKKSSFKPPYWQDLIIMECHVRDLLRHSQFELSEEERRGFPGLVKWIKEKANYIRLLGVNTIELQPIQEYEYNDRNEYQWGYMPTNYFSPASGYAGDPEKGSQIEEFRAVVDAFHEAGIAVILDVVYNHVGNPNHLMRLDKESYFHIAPDHTFMNWSGCGNDLRCESPMAKKLILESLLHMLRCYKVDGFRFDLAELIGKSTLIEIEAVLKNENPAVILIAEPWSFRGHIGPTLRNTGWASWNDGFRNYMADYVREKGNQEGIAYFLKGSPDGYARFPSQTVNYTESHDDRCWIDIITENHFHNGSTPTLRDIKRTHIMFAILFSSIGIPMIGAGQDFLKSKHGKNNTYLDGEENALDYLEAVEHAATYEYVVNWIKFRKSSWGELFRLQSRQSESYIRFLFTEGFSSVIALFNADGSMGSRRIALALNPHLRPAKFTAANEVDWESMVQVADTSRWNMSGIIAGSVPIKNNIPTLPKLSCALWVSKE